MLLSTEVERLGVEGFFIRDAFLGTALARRLRQEALSMPLRRAGIRRDRAIDEAVRSDSIAWLDPEAAQGCWQEACARFSTLMRELNEGAWLGLRNFDLQLSRYEPGDAYQRHRDAFPGEDNRRVTALLYLNEGWKREDGGLLRLYVEPQSIDVEPMLDRLVIFRSEVVEHEVLAAHAERWALTAWFSAR